MSEGNRPLSGVELALAALVVGLVLSPVAFVVLVLVAIVLEARP